MYTNMGFYPYEYGMWILVIGRIEKNNHKL